MAVFTIGVVVHPTRPTERSLVAIADWARSNDARVIGRLSDTARLGEVPVVELVADELFAAQVDGLVSLGGDGTMLGAMRLVADRPDAVPVIGVNYGHLGFLIELGPDDLPAALDRLVNRDFVLEDRHGLEVEILDGPASGRWIAFNDVVLGHPTGGSVSADLRVNDARYGYYRCDALVVSTPMGSTAYNHAAGGPIVSPAAAVSVVTPVAPMAGISRALVLGGEERVRLELDVVPAPLVVSVDGTTAATVTEPVQLLLRLLPSAGHIVRFDPEAHGQRSRTKLSLLDLPLRQDQLLELIPPELRARGRIGGTESE